MKKLVFYICSTSCFLQLAIKLHAQASGSGEAMAPTALSGIGVSGGTYATAGNTVYLGAGAYTINGTWEIYAQNVWISPTAAISGTGTIVFYNPSVAGGTASASLVDGNNNPTFVNVNILQNNTSTLSLTDMAAPSGSGWVDSTGQASLTSGAVLTFGVSGGHVVTNGYKLVLSSTGTLSGYSTDRYVETNTNAGELVKQGVAANSSFFFPVGSTASSYTPANIAAGSGGTDNYHVNVNNFSTSPTSPSNDTYFTSLPNVQRTWLMYSDAGAATTSPTFYHYAALQQNSYSDNSTEIYWQSNATTWKPGANAACATELTPVYGGTQYYGQTIQNVILPACAGCSSSSYGSYYTKTMCANISGNVWADANANAIQDGAEANTNGGGLFANLINGGVLAQSVAVNASTGGYSFGSLLSGTYSVVLTKTSTATTSTLNSGWVNTGVNLNGTANTGNKTGSINVALVTTSVTAQNFGILLCSSTGLSITATASPTVVCASSPVPISLTSKPSGGVASYATYAWAGQAIANSSIQNTTANPTASGTYSVTVTDALGCTATGSATPVTYDHATPNISVTCGTNASGKNYAQLDETNGTSWLWTTTSGGRFYPDNTLSTSNDASTSTLQAPFIDYNGTYSVAITDANGCNGSGSIPITSATCTAILAASNLDFTVTKQDNEAVLNWSTASETDNSYFNIERSADGSNWQVIGTVQGQGNSGTLAKYSFTDALPLAGTNYYRLRLVDVNGQYSYSPVKYLVFTGQWLVKLYPNPVQNFVVLEFNNDKDEKANIVIQSVLGNSVFVTWQQLTAGLNRITLNQVQQLAAGTYMVVLSTTGNTYRSKFVKGGN